MGTPKNLNCLVSRQLPPNTWGRHPAGYGIAVGFGEVPFAGVGASEEEAALAAYEQVLVAFENRLRDAVEHGEAAPGTLTRVRDLNLAYINRLRTLHQLVLSEQEAEAASEQVQESPLDPFRFLF